MTKPLLLFALLALVGCEARAQTYYTLEGLKVTTPYTARWFLMIFEGKHRPPDGPVKPVKCYAVTGPFMYAKFSPVLRSPQGFTLAVSRNGCFIKTTIPATLTVSNTGGER